MPDKSPIDFPGLRNGRLVYLLKYPYINAAAVEASMPKMNPTKRSFQAFLAILEECAASIASTVSFCVRTIGSSLLLSSWSLLRVVSVSATRCLSRSRNALNSESCFSIPPI